MKFPKTQQEDVVDVLHGIEVKDPYRWLEDGESQEVSDWILEQNEFLKENINQYIFKKATDELVQNFKVTTYGLPVNKGKYFFTERKPDEDQGVLYCKDSLEGEPTILVNPNELGKNTTSLDFWFPSKNGKYIAYGLSVDGDEMATLYIKDVDKNEDLDYSIPRCRYSRVSWLPDESGFFYTRNPREGEVPEDESHLYTKIFFHKIGQDPNDDEMIFGEDRPKDDLIGISLSIDGRYLAISASQSWTEGDMFVYETKTRKIKPLIVGIKAKSY